MGMGKTTALPARKILMMFMLSFAIFCLFIQLANRFMS